jgi:dipeptidase D
MNSEPNVEFEFGIVPETKTVSGLTGNSFGSFLYFLIQAPNGIQRMSSAIPGLVESSLNMGIVFTEEQKAVIRFSLRSSVTSYKQFMSSKLDYLISILGGESSTEGEYPAWEYKSESDLREAFKALYEEEYGKEPVFEVMHAGLECGLLFDKCPGLDIISIGPDMRDVHSPNESLDLESAVRVYKFLEKLICRL